MSTENLDTKTNGLIIQNDPWLTWLAVQPKCVLGDG